MTTQDASKYGFKPDPGEETLRVVHRHPVTLVPSVGAALGMLLLSLGLMYISARYPQSVPHSGELAIMLALVLTVISIATFLISIYVYRRNVLIFTTIHLIQSEQVGLFNHQISQVDFRRVQDVSGKKIGVWQSIFNFGQVEVQSAGEQEKFIFHGAPHPAELADDALQTRDTCIHNLALKNDAASADPNDEEDLPGSAKRNIDT